MSKFEIRHLNFCLTNDFLWPLWFFVVLRLHPLRRKAQSDHFSRSPKSLQRLPVEDQIETTRISNLEMDSFQRSVGSRFSRFEGHFMLGLAIDLNANPGFLDRLEPE